MWRDNDGSVRRVGGLVCRDTDFATAGWKRGKEEGMERGKAGDYLAGTAMQALNFN
jgi:hypothetical protein